MNELGAARAASSENGTGDTVVYTFPKNRREELRATLTTFNGHELADLRIWAHVDDSDVPTRKGISVKVGQLPKLLEAVEALMQASKAA